MCRAHARRWGKRLFPQLLLPLLLIKSEQIWVKWPVTSGSCHMRLRRLLLLLLLLSWVSRLEWMLLIFAWVSSFHYCAVPTHCTTTYLQQCRLTLFLSLIYAATLIDLDSDTAGGESLVPRKRAELNRSCLPQAMLLKVVSKNVSKTSATPYYAVAWFKAAVIRFSCKTSFASIFKPVVGSCCT